MAIHTILDEKNFHKALCSAFIIFRPGLSDANRKAECCAAFRQHLETLNTEMHNEINSHLEAAVNNIIANARYRFLEPSGPKIGKVTEKEPLMFQ